MNFSYIFSQNELKMLFALAGYKSVFGIHLNSDKVTADCAAYTFNNLYNQGLIIRKDRGFVIESNVLKILKLIAKHDGYMVVNPADCFLDSLFCYAKNGEFAVCSKVNVSPEKIKVSVFSSAEFSDFILENSYIPNSDSCIALDDAELEKFEKNIDLESPDLSDKNSKMYFKIVFYNKDNTEVSKIFLLKYFMYDYMIVKNKENVKRQVYTKDSLIGLIELYSGV